MLLTVIWSQEALLPFEFRVKTMLNRSRHAPDLSTSGFASLLFRSRIPSIIQPTVKQTFSLEGQQLLILIAQNLTEEQRSFHVSMSGVNFTQMSWKCLICIWRRRAWALMSRVQAFAPSQTNKGKKTKTKRIRQHGLLCMDEGSSCVALACRGGRPFKADCSR